MFTLIIRALILYIVILIVIRLMGKRQLGEMQPFELVITLIIADLSCIPMTEVSIPLLHGIIPLLTLVVLHYFMSVLSRKSIKLRKFFNGKPIIVIDPKGIRYDALKQLNMTLNDLSEGLRGCSHFSFDQVAYAIIETNGKLSVLAKSQNSPPTSQDLNIKTEDSSLNIMLINDGKLIKENLQNLKIEQSFIEKILDTQKIKKINDVLIFSINKQGIVYLQPKKASSVIINTKFRGQ